ncbi:MAG: grasp-with-spasm system ATP-grasp peptide maturase [Bacteroidales bacterium]|nr:grasp-with-spasm system ATP-grasp peptide maturase [Bacteroidales bacterium]
MSIILIISKDFDPDVDSVIDHLHFLGKQIIRITPTTDFNFSYLNILSKRVGIDIELIVNNSHFKLSDIYSVWIRNGILPNLFGEYFKIPLDNIDKEIETFLNREWYILKEYIFHLIQIKKHVGNFFTGFPNKLMQLEYAQECGLSIPNTSVVTEKEVLKKYTKNKKYITKPIQEVFSYTEKKAYYVSRTGYINIPEPSISGLLFPTLIQKKIEKKHEIRTFFIDNEFYSCAIFSKENKNNSIDYRAGDITDIRSVPFRLPEDIRNKLCILMKRMQIDCGGIDMIYSTSNEFVFLEVNPVGIFQNVSELCNYNLEMKIAEKLI